MATARRRQVAAWLAAGALHVGVLFFGLGLTVDPGMSSRATPIDVVVVDAPPIVPDPIPEAQVPARVAAPVRAPPAASAAPVPQAPPPVSIPRTRQDGPVEAVIRLPTPPEPAGGKIGQAERRALAGVFCDRLTQTQQWQADCEDGAAGRAAYAPLYEATPLADQALFDEIYVRQLQANAGAGAVEAFLARNSGVPPQMFGDIAVADALDNSAFMDARQRGAADRDRIAAGQSPSWEDDIRRAHTD